MRLFTTVAILALLAASAGGVPVPASTITGVLNSGHGGTGLALSPRSGGIAYGTGTAINVTAAGTTNQVLISRGLMPPIWATLSTIPVGSVASSITGLLGATAGNIRKGLLSDMPSGLAYVGTDNRNADSLYFDVPSRYQTVAHTGIFTGDTWSVARATEGGLIGYIGFDERGSGTWRLEPGLYSSGTANIRGGLTLGVALAKADGGTGNTTGTASALLLATNASAGRVLTSDVNGTGVWEDSVVLRDTGSPVGLWRLTVSTVGVVGATKIGTIPQ